jgi:hypothetical protein
LEPLKGTLLVGVDRCLAKRWFKYLKPEMTIGLPVFILAVLRMAIGLAEQQCTTPVETLFLGTFFNDVFHGPDCTFRWNCGMVFRGQIEQSLRCGPGRLELVDGSVFECNFSAMPDDRLEEQHGIFLLEHGMVRVDGSVKSGGVQWHSTREEQELSPFLIVQVGDGRWAHISDKRGVLEWCGRNRFSDEPVVMADGYMAYVFRY